MAALTGVRGYSAPYVPKKRTRTQGPYAMLWRLPSKKTSRIARELAESPEDYAPVLGTDADSGEALWEPWIDGFERAMRLRRGVWRQIVQSGDREAAAAINMIVALSDSCYGRSDLTEEAEKKLGRLAPGLIPEFVRNLNAWRKSRQGGERNRGPAG